MIIERANVEDAEQILYLQKRAYQSEAAIYDDDTIPPLTQTLEDIRADFAKQVYLKATIDDQIVGSVRAHVTQGTCFIGRLIVHPDFQNQGIGTALLDEIERTFAQSDRFELFTGSKSERNLRFYCRRGYRPLKREPISPDLTLVYLEKSVRI